MQKVTALQIGLPDYMRTNSIPIDDEGLKERQWTSVGMKATKCYVLGYWSFVQINVTIDLASSCSNLMKSIIVRGNMHCLFYSCNEILFHLFQK